MTSASADSTASSRPVTPRVSRRAWIDPHVRTAWLAGIALWVIGAGFLLQRFAIWRQAAHLVEDGVLVDATIAEVNGSAIPGRSQAGDTPVTLRFERDGKPYEFKVPYLEGRAPEDSLIVGKTVKIRIDAADPNRWTPRQVPTPLVQELFGGGSIAATGFLLCILAAILHSKLLKTYGSAPLTEAVVLSARHAAIAPRAWLARCSPVAEGDNRVFTVYTPAHVKVANATLRLLTPAHGRVLSMEWFE